MTANAANDYLKEWTEQRDALARILKVAEHLCENIEETEKEIAKRLLPPNARLGETYIIRLWRDDRQKYLEITVLSKGYKLVWRK